MKFLVPNDKAVPLRRRIGENITVVNQTANDVFFDTDPNRLNAAVVGGVPEGTKIANTTGQIQFSDYPGIMWFRAAVANATVDVQP